MKKYFLLIIAAALMTSCGTTKKSGYKSVDARDVPEKYVKDFVRQRPEIKDVRWEMADSTQYFANFRSNDLDCMMKFTPNYTATYYVVPQQYIHSEITDYIKQNYPSYKISKAYIVDMHKVRNYEITINNKTEEKKLQFDVKGNFNKVID
ncbi:MAG: PepSY-like domain-containing protein [Bacteroidales bacterium]|nr:PepSY-like domain-containing protein [Bacteroidales bacterium]MBQ7984653.1 PepSY-like domain-containing protein [Bacteroidales bacterium]